MAISIGLDEDLREGIERFIAARDEAPAGRMSYDVAVSVIVQDWLIGQGYLPLPGEEDRITTAMEAARVPKG